MLKGTSAREEVKFFRHIINYTTFILLLISNQVVTAQTYSDRTIVPSHRRTIHPSSFVTYTSMNIYIGKNISEIRTNSSYSYQFFTSKGILIFNISYSISSFNDSLENNNIQLGLDNEWGLQNLGIYYRAGPELRLFKNYYITLNGGVGFGLAAGAERAGIAFLYFLGAASGVDVQLFKSTFINLEADIIYTPSAITCINIKGGVKLDLF